VDHDVGFSIDLVPRHQFHGAFLKPLLDLGVRYPIYPQGEAFHAQHRDSAVEPPEVIYDVQQATVKQLRTGAEAVNRFAV
jgi:hypothetical protein